jgi:hypothetical protein
LAKGCLNAEAQRTQRKTEQRDKPKAGPSQLGMKPSAGGRAALKCMRPFSTKSFISITIDHRSLQVLYLHIHCKRPRGWGYDFLRKWVMGAMGGQWLRVWKHGGYGSGSEILMVVGSCRIEMQGTHLKQRLDDIPRWPKRRACSDDSTVAWTKFGIDKGVWGRCGD